MRSQIAGSRPLRDLVRTYRAGFAIQSSDVEIRGRVVQVTFHLELSGYHDGRCDDAFCLSCNHVLRVLFEVADALRPIERDAFKRAGYEKRAHYASGRGPHREVALGLDLTVRRRFPRATGGWGWAFVERIRATLMELGCRDRAAEEFRDCRPCDEPVMTERAESAEASVPMRPLKWESLLTV